MEPSLIVDLLGRWISGSREIAIKNVQLSVRKRSAASLLHLCREHCGSICLLLKLGRGEHLSSALALLRPGFEACLRGVWVDKCLADTAYEVYRNVPGKDLPGRGTILKDLEHVLSPRTYMNLSEHAEEVKNLYHDFAHGGHQQILRRFGGGGGFRHRATKAEERYVATRAMLYDSIASQWLAELAGDDEAKHALLRLHESLDPQAYYVADKVGE